MRNVEYRHGMAPRNKLQHGPISNTTAFYRSPAIFVLSLYAEDGGEVAEVGDGVVRRAVLVLFGSLVGVEHDGPHADLLGAVDVTVHIVADVEGLLGRHG